MAFILSRKENISPSVKVFIEHFPDEDELRFIACSTFFASYFNFAASVRLHPLL